MLLDQITALYRYDPEAFQGLHVILAMSGAMLCVYVMNLTSYELEDHSDPGWVRWGTRAGYALTALALFWSIGYVDVHRWQPCLPLILLIFAVNVSMLVRAIAIHLRIRREGGRRVGLITHQQAKGRLRSPF